LDDDNAKLLLTLEDDKKSV